MSEDDHSDVAMDCDNARRLERILPWLRLEVSGGLNGEAAFLSPTRIPEELGQRFALPMRQGSPSDGVWEHGSLLVEAQA